MDKRYWLQTQAPAGNWVDSFGSDLEGCIRHGEYLEANYKEKCRVIERNDTVVHTFAKGIS